MNDNTLKSRINADVKTALKARESEKLTTLRMILAAIKQIEVDERIELDDARITAILVKMEKERINANKEFKAGNRDDLVEKNLQDIIWLKAYLPEPLSEADITSIIDKAMADTGAASIKDMGKVMGIVKPQIQGRADMGRVSGIIKERLS